LTLTALTGCVLCLILVLKVILYTGIVHPGDRLVHPPYQVVLEGDTISWDTGHCTPVIFDYDSMSCIVTTCIRNEQ